MKKLFLAIVAATLSLALAFCASPVAPPPGEGGDEGAGGHDTGMGGRDGGGEPPDIGGYFDASYDAGHRDAGGADGGGDGGDVGPCNGADLMSDPNNCGVCGKACAPANIPDSDARPTISECVAGNCAVAVNNGCKDGRGDCDRSYDNGCEAWLGSDKDNCGVCGLACAIPHASADCTFSTCVLLSCDTGWEDCNLNLGDGCEAHLDDDIDNCGRCGRRCIFPHATGTCTGGNCVRTACDPDWYDIDGFPEDGCEYYCKPAHPSATEICGDHEDNNCNGEIDEGCSQACSPGDTIPCGSDVGECRPGHFPCVNGKWDFSTCVGMAGPKPEECNNKDDDCNGEIDDNLVKPCAAADSSWCETKCGTGWWECRAGVWEKVPPPSGGAEVCNGLDDDCNGKVDDGYVACPAGMTNIGVCFCVDRFEASRPDATDKDEGAQNGPATSRSGVLPWRDVTWSVADAACRAAGKRLCTAAEWRQACQGIAGTKYPYGDTYGPTTCNGADASPLNAKLAASGSFAQCRSDYGVYDMSGNVEEWNSTDYPNGQKGLRGGSYNTGDTPYMRCDYDAPPSSPAFSSPQIGFRCCKDP